MTDSSARLPKSQKTRNRIISAAREIIARKGTEFTLQEVTSAADVAVGTFYLHFSTKQELFRAVALSAFGDWEEQLLPHLENINNLLVRQACALRFFARMADQFPQEASIVKWASPLLGVSSQGYSEKFKQDVAQLVAEGIFTAENVEAKLIAATAAMERALTMRSLNIAFDDNHIDDVVEAVLVMFGADAQEAHHAAHCALPAL